MADSVMRWVVAHAGSRDDYQVARALAEHDMLEALVTDWYARFDQWWFGLLMRIAPGRVRRLFSRRFRDALPSRLVRGVAPQTIINEALHRPSAGTDAIIGTSAGSLAARSAAGVLAYSYYANAAFAAAGENTPKVIFQVHPHPDSLRALFSEEMRLVPECAASLGSEVEMSESDEVLAGRRLEPTLADCCLVASSYTRQTLVENGVDESRIRVIPYGVNVARFGYSPPRARDAVFRVLFVGQMVQRKGLKYLLEAWHALSLKNAELVLVGRGRSDESLLERYRGSYRRESSIDNARLSALYGESDVFCMPSLAEGFGLVYLESMACGTPVIATRNTGAADVVTDGEDGFLIDIRDVDALRERLAWCHANRDALAAMRPRARRTAEKHSWETFRASIAATLNEVTSTPATARV